jgi:hypothetical protein
MRTRHFYWILTGPFFCSVHTSQSRWEGESPERKGVEREEKKEFSLHRELSSPLLSADTDCNFQQFKFAQICANMDRRAFVQCARPWRGVIHRKLILKDGVL